MCPRWCERELPLTPELCLGCFDEDHSFTFNFCGGGAQVKRGNEVNKKMGLDKQCRSVQVTLGLDSSF